MIIIFIIILIWVIQSLSHLMNASLCRSHIEPRESERARELDTLSSSSPSRSLSRSLSVLYHPGSRSPIASCTCLIDIIGVNKGAEVDLLAARMSERERESPDQRGCKGISLSPSLSYSLFPLSPSLSLSLLEACNSL